jgi:hypothetical protein
MISAEMILANMSFFSLLFSPIGLMIGLISLFTVVYWDTRRESKVNTLRCAANSFLASFLGVWNESMITFLVMIALITGGGTLAFLSSIPVYISLVR